MCRDDGSVARSDRDRDDDDDDDDDEHARDEGDDELEVGSARCERRGRMDSIRDLI